MLGGWRRLTRSLVVDVVRRPARSAGVSAERLSVWLGGGERRGVWRDGRAWFERRRCVKRRREARMRASASWKACCQGQRAGRCRVQRRAVLVSRAGSASSRRRTVRAARTVWPGRPSTEVQRSRLCARLRRADRGPRAGARPRSPPQHPGAPEREQEAVPALVGQARLITLAPAGAAIARPLRPGWRTRGRQVDHDPHFGR
jgi:hypothetical protein